MAVTMRDVARAAQVDPSVVSAVLNGSKSIRVSIMKRELILSLVNEMNYRPNITARSLVTKKTHAIGLLYHRVVDQSHAERINEIQSYLLEQGYVSIISGWHTYGQSFFDAYDTLISRGVDGIICAHPETGRFARDTPAILHFYRDKDYDSVYHDFRAAITQAFQYLHELGHQRIGFVGSLSDGWGYSDFLYANGNDARYSFFNTGLQAGALAVAHFLAMPRRPTAVICQCDTLAIRFISEAIHAGWEVPGQLSVIGFNNIADAALIHPTLTTFDSSIAKSARLLVDMLLARIPRPDLPVRHVLLDQKMIIRNSCAVCHEK